MLFSLALTILFSFPHPFFFFFLIIDLHVLIPAAIVQIFNPILELVIRIVIPNKETKAEFETDPVIPEAKIRKYSI